MANEARQVAVTKNERTRITFTTGGAGGTTFQVDRRSIERYLVLWLTKLPINYAHVNEIRAGT